jgi:hypothetical protein
VVGIAHAASPLCPFILDMRTLNGKSIDHMMPFFSEFSPVLNISRDDGSNQTALLFPERSNHTMYVMPSTYTAISGLYGWLDQFLYRTNSSFELIPNQGITLACRVRMVSISLQISPDFILDSLYYQNDRDLDYHFGQDLSPLTPPYPDFWYIIMPNESLCISMSYTSGNVNYRHSFSFEVDSVGSSDYILTINLPYFSVLGMNLSSGEFFIIIFILGLVGGILLQSEQLRTARTRSLITRDPRFYSSLFLIASIFVPWFSYYSIISGGIFSQRIVVEQMDIMLPLSIMLRRSPGIAGFPVYENYIWLEVPTLIFLLWLPLRSSILRIGRKNYQTFDLWYFLCILSPLILGICYLLFIPYQLTIRLGMVCAGLSPVVYGVGILIYRYEHVRSRWRRVHHGSIEGNER